MSVVFLSSIVFVLGQEAQPVGMGMSVAVQCYRNNQPFDCSQTSVTTTTSTTSTSSTSAASATTATSSETSASSTTSTTSETTQTPTETSSTVSAAQTNPATGFDISNSGTQAGLVIIAIVIVAALFLYSKGYLRRDSGYRYHYKQ